MECCADCGSIDLHPDYKKLAVIAFRRTLCRDCYRKAKMPKRTCPKCGVLSEVVDEHNVRCQNCRVADSVGADFFECDCGNTVPIAESVRLMRKSTGRIERVCMKCSQDGACAKDQHSLVTSRHKDWDESKWTFQPVPESLQRAVCARCDVQMYWDSKDWRRMTWAVLADFWEKADA